MNGNERMPTKVKICGITNWTDAKLAIDAGANALGFNFYPKSSRFVSLGEARQIRRRMPANVEAVGVFVNASVEEVDEVGVEADLLGVQLHGEEPPAVAEALADFYVVIKAFRVGPQFSLEQLKAYRRDADFLLDGFVEDARGGTGESFDWSVAHEAKKLLRPKFELYLAGGLTAENVCAAIHEARPHWVDVCSGIESSPGRKDAAKLRAFVEEVRLADRKPS